MAFSTLFSEHPFPHLNGYSKKNRGNYPTKCLPKFDTRRPKKNRENYPRKFS